MLDQIRDQHDKLLAQNIDIKVMAISTIDGLMINEDGIDLTNWRETTKKMPLKSNVDDIIAFGKDKKPLKPVFVDCTASYDLPVQYTIVASTGVIGMPLPVDKIVSGIEQSKAKLASLNEGAALASQAIMTTDSVPKNAEAVVKLDGVDVHFWGMCKGAGMIHPNMSTMLGFVLSDAAIDTVFMGFNCHIESVICHFIK